MIFNFEFSSIELWNLPKIFAIQCDLWLNDIIWSLTVTVNRWSLKTLKPHFTIEKKNNLNVCDGITVHQ